ncbi:MAG: protein translocase subunit SecF [Candidatus Yanofskybacteria bacterium]|nr:protein translocase subunit SecF [Candidatus Yanofskybacteria bacterium]
MKLAYKILFFISVSMAVLAIISTFVFGLNFGTDFKGGAMLEVQFNQGVEVPEVQKVSDVLAESENLGEVSVSPVGEDSLILRLKEIDEATHQKILTDLKTAFGDLQEERFDSVGAAIGGELKRKSLTATILVLVLIVLYIAFVFRKLSKTLSPFAMGVAALIALAHDVLIPIGVFAFLGEYYGIEVTGVFVAAILTILGFSVSDTVVIFDRVRENVLRFGAPPTGRAGKEDFGSLVHSSVMQTLTRSLNTTFTVLLSLIAIYFFGGESIKYFSLAMIIGIFLGAYSSISVASPILVWWSKKK